MQEGQKGGDAKRSRDWWFSQTGFAKMVTINRGSRERERERWQNICCCVYTINLKLSGRTVLILWWVSPQPIYIFRESMTLHHSFPSVFFFHHSTAQAWCCVMPAQVCEMLLCLMELWSVLVRCVCLQLRIKGIDNKPRSEKKVKVV